MSYCFLKIYLWKIKTTRVYKERWKKENAEDLDERYIEQQEVYLKAKKIVNYKGETTWYDVYRLRMKYLK